MTISFASRFSASFLGGGEIVGDGSSRRLAASLSACLAERVEDLGDRPLQVLDVSPHEKEFPLNLLDRKILRHHVADTLDLAHHVRRIHPLRALVLALPPDPDTPRKEAELNVLPQRRLAELDVVCGQRVEDLLRGDPLRMLALEAIEHLVGDPLQGFPSGKPRGRPAPSTPANVFHSVEWGQFEGARLLSHRDEMRQGTAFRVGVRTFYVPQTPVRGLLSRSIPKRLRAFAHPHLHPAA